MKKLFKIMVIFILPCIIWCQPTQAQEGAAVLSLMVGTVEYLQSGSIDWTEATEGMSLFSGDAVRTGADGMVTITFASGSTVSLKQDSEFKVKSLQLAANKKDIDCKLQLARGKLRAIVEQLGEDETFEIETPTAVAAVRGTTFYMIVREAQEHEIPPQVKERLLTELFVEDGGVIYTNTISGKFYTVRTSNTSTAYGDGQISLPIEIPEDRQQEFKQGWEDILAAEPYQLPEDTTVQDVVDADTGDTPEEEGNVRQSDQGNQALDALLALIQQALAASEQAAAAAEKANEAAKNASQKRDELNDTKDEMLVKKDEMTGSKQQADDTLSQLQNLCSNAQDKANQAQAAINQVIDNEANKTSGYIIVDINALVNRLAGLQSQLDGLADDISNFEQDNITQLQDGADTVQADLQQAADTASYWAQEAQQKIGELQDAIDDATTKGTEAALEALRVLVDITQETIQRALDAALAADKSAEDADSVIDLASDVIDDIRAFFGALEDVIADTQALQGQLDLAIATAEDFINDANGIISHELLSTVVALQEEHEKNVVWQQMQAKLREKAFLRSEIRDILQENQERRVEGYIEKIADAKMGKVFKNIHGERVRVEQYILRPASNVVELLNVNLRAGDDLTTMEWITAFNSSLDALPTGQLKTLPWDNYLDTRSYYGSPYIYTPEHPQGIYPESMSVAFSHNDDAFSESRQFGERQSRSGKQSIYDRTLWVKNFNDNQPMDYQSIGWPGIQQPGTYSIESGIENADIGGGENNPSGFRYQFASTEGEYSTLGSSFYVISDNGVRQDYGALAVDDIWDALRVNMGEKQIGMNNLEMVFNSDLFTSPIDLIYVPTGSMDWKPDDHIPDYSLPGGEEGPAEVF